MAFVRALRELHAADAPAAGGKGANLGELVNAGFAVPDGFVVLLDAYLATISAAGVRKELATLHAETLASAADTGKLAENCARMQELARQAVLPPEVREPVLTAYRTLGPVSVAVRSSAIGEDAPHTSYAGMTATFAQVWGEHAVLEHISACWASLFAQRLVAYRASRGLTGEPGMAVVVQRRIEPQRAGVTFTADPRTAQPTTAVVEAVFGRNGSGAGVVTEPDTYLVSKDDLRVLGARVAHRRVLDQAMLLRLVRLACRVEDHFSTPQDIEWVIDREGEIWLVQTRPITSPPDGSGLDRPAATGLGAAPGVATGVVRVLNSPAESDRFGDGEVLVTPMTDPDWVPTIRRSAALVTDGGGLTAHGAIVARELGVPCVVGTGNATQVLTDGQLVTVDGGRGEVRVVWASLPVRVHQAEQPPAVTEAIGTRLYLDLSVPIDAPVVAALPCDGVGLLRSEGMVVGALGRQHPHEALIRGAQESVVDAMVSALLAVAEPFAPRPVVYRVSDLRTPEFRELAGGSEHEPVESSALLGYHGCYRHVRQPALLGLELQALARARERAPNLQLMVPFVRTRWELEEFLRLVDTSPLGRQRGLQRWITAEVPSVLYWLPSYVGLGIDGVAIGIDELTQLLLGVERDSQRDPTRFDELDAAVLDAITHLAGKASALEVTSTAFGQVLAQHPQLAEHLVRVGITGICVAPDAALEARAAIAAAERRLLLGHIAKAGG